MPVMTETMVSAEEMADVRRWAREAAELAGPGDDHLSRRVLAVCAALDWAAGTARFGPVSGAGMEPTQENLEFESRRAWDEESELRRRRERTTYPGAVHATLEFVLGRTEAPF